MESWCYIGPDFKRIEALVTKYGEGDKRDIAQRFEEWKDGATQHLKTMTKPVFTPKPKKPRIAA